METIFDQRRARPIILLLVLIAVLVASLAGCADDGQPGATVPAAAQSDATPVSQSDASGQSGERSVQSSPAQRYSDLPVIRYQNLPKEARETVRLIEQGGPFPFDRDGITFQNRERILPRQPAGYYREYTVITPGSRDRGARRIVAGVEGEYYYTDDHYESFREVMP